MTGILLGYLALLILYSLAFARRAVTEAGFYVSDRKLDTPTLSLTLAATTIGGSAVVVTGTLIHRYGPAGILPDLAGAAGLVLLGLTVANRIRRTGAFTLPELLQHHYPEHLVRLFALAIALAELAWLALSFRTLAMVTGMGTGMLILVGILTWIYSFVGGQWSVSRTDILQFGLIATGFTMAVSGQRLPVAAPEHWPDPTLWYVAALMFFSHIVGPDITVKLLSARDERTASRSAVTAGLLKAAVSLLVLTAFTRGLRLEAMPVVLFLGVTSAILSSVDSMFISATAVIQRDVLRIPARRWTPHLIGAALLALSLGVTLTSTGVVDILATGYTLFLVSLFFPTLIVLIRGRASVALTLVPAAVFLSAWLPLGKPVAFFAAFAAGGLTIAVQNRHRS